jgi:peptide/nickel transport system substrate-binding protein
MNWSKIFFWLKKPKSPTSNFDKKLVKKIQSRFWPNWSQFKYIRHFLTPAEKKATKISFLIIFLTIVGWGIIFMVRNGTVVPAAGGEYTEALIGQPKLVNPLFASANDVDADLCMLVYSGLFKYEKQTLIPDLASDYTVSADNKTYDLNLRKDVRWSDGEPFTADDIIYTFETIQDPEVTSPLLPAFQGVQVEKTGDYSVRFTLKEPFTPFLSSLTVGILPQHIWTDIPPSSMKLAKTNTQPVGTGPWKFSKLTKDNTGNIQTYSLVPNDDYYRKPPYLKTLNLKFYSDYSQAASALKSRDVNGLSFIPGDLAEKVSGKNFQIYKFKLPQYTALFFNQVQETALKDGDLRNALELSLDRKKILNDALNGDAEMTNSPILRGSLGFDPKIMAVQFNPARADELLDKKWKRIQPEEYYQKEYERILKTRKDEIDALKINSSTTPDTVSSSIAQIEKDTADSVRAGMVSDQSFYRSDKDGKILAIDITTADTPEYKQVADVIAKLWRLVGIKSAVITIDGHDLAKEILKPRNYQVLLYGEILGGDPDPYPFWHSSQVNYPGLNLSMFVDRNADKLLEQARTTMNDDERAGLYKKFQEILAKEIPAIFLYTPTYNWAIGNDIKGVWMERINSPSDRFGGITEWYTKTKKQWKFK